MEYGNAYPKVGARSAEQACDQGWYVHDMIPVNVSWCVFSGYVQTPGWDGHTRYPNNMDSCVHVQAPPHHVIMITFTHMDLNERLPRRTMKGGEKKNMKTIGSHPGWVKGQIPLKR